MRAVGKKRCTRCHRWKSHLSFAVYRGAPDGLQYNCKACQHVYYVNRYKKKKQHILAVTKAYRTTHQTKVSGYKRRYYEAHKEQYNADLRRWRKANWRRHYVNHLAKRQALLRGATISDFTLEDWIEVLEQYGYQCAYCKSTSKLTMDHIVPLSKGGQHTQRNIAPACGPCNSRKGATLL